MSDKLCRKTEYLKDYLSGVDFKNLSVLDAGTGRTSAQFLLDCKPGELICLTKKGDLRKGSPVEQILKDNNEVRNSLVYGSIADKELFPEASFNFIMADYLIGELSVESILVGIENLRRWLKPTGTILVVDREFYKKPEPELDIISMGKISANVDITTWSNFDVCAVLNLFFSIPKSLLLFSEKERSYDYPSFWVELWLKSAGFSSIVKEVFDSPENLKHEYNERLAWTKERINDIKNVSLKDGLLIELSKITNEFEKRDIPEDEVYIRKHYSFVCKK